MPLTFSEWKDRENDAKFQTLLENRQPVVRVVGTVNVNEPLDVHLDQDPLPVTIER